MQDTGLRALEGVLLVVTFFKPHASRNRERRVESLLKEHGQVKSLRVAFILSVSPQRQPGLSVSRSVARAAGAEGRMRRSQALTCRLRRHISRGCWMKWDCTALQWMPVKICAMCQPGFRTLPLTGGKQPSSSTPELLLPIRRFLHICKYSC